MVTVPARARAFETIRRNLLYDTQAPMTNDLARSQQEALNLLSGEVEAQYLVPLVPIVGPATPAKR
jgi:hypothetical protein